MLYLCRVKPLRHYLRGFLIAAWAGDKIAEFSFPEISFHFPLRPWFFFVSPAYAGKSSRPLRPPECRKDHPRVCGEKQKKSPTGLVTRGSPPHVRGKGADEQGVGGVAGITPAYAGKRVRCSQQALPCTDHPRMCGEKRQDRLDYYVPQGSPPHVRGKGGDGNDRGLHARITPACAGKRIAGRNLLCGQWDHPRMCGEK